jgi:sugar/nucleoside kinase (ribokinase family)
MINQDAFDVTVIGSLGIDTNIYLQNGEINFEVEANFTENIDYVGQAGGYASRGYAQLGYRTAFIGHVGDDFNGHFVREELSRDGIDASLLFLDPSGTSRSINFMYPDGRRKNFYDGKGHMGLQIDTQACAAILRRSKLAHFNIPNWGRDLLPIAKANGITVACDIQDITSIDDPYREDYIQYADILFFSAVNYDDPSPLLNEFLRRNSNQIVISGRGAKGCALGTNEGIRFFPAVDLEVPIIDTNGAGDGLAVGFLSSYIFDGYSLEEAILRGQITARYTCSLKATTSQLIRQDILDHYYQNMK